MMIFFQPEGEPSLQWMKNRILELSRFMMNLLEPMCQMFEEAINQKNFDDVIRRFDDLIFESLDEKTEVKP